jgi:hypothetical protein
MEGVPRAIFGPTAYFLIVAARRFWGDGEAFHGG